MENSDAGAYGILRGERGIGEGRPIEIVQLKSGAKKGEVVWGKEGGGIFL